MALPPPDGAAPARLRGPLAFLLAGAGTVARQPAVLALLLLWSLLTALPAALPWYASALEHLAPAAGFPDEPLSDLARGGPRWLFDDWLRRDPGLRQAASSLVPLLPLSSLAGLVVTGGWMGLAVQGQRRAGLAAFLHAGGRYFLRFARTWLLGLALSALVTWGVWGAPGEWVLGFFVPEGDLDLASSERVALWLANAQLLGYGLLLFLLELVLDLARASLVAGDRRSAVFALLRGAGFLLFEPRRTFGLVLAGWMLEAAWVAGLWALHEEAVLPLWSLCLLVPLGRIALRGARLTGLAALYAAARTSRRARRVPAPSTFDDGTAWAGA